MNLMKFSSVQSIGHLCKHYSRDVDADKYGNKDIDTDKLDMDKTNLAPDRGKETDYIKHKIQEIADGKTIRKDAVRMCCWVVDMPKTLSKAKQDEFFQESYNFLIQRYGTKSGMGEDVCISAYIHNSESTPHMHFAFIPIIEKNGEKKLCAKECIDRNELKTFHEDFARYMESKGICTRKDILNGNTQRDANGRALSVKELKRNRNIERNRETNRWESRNTERERNRW